MARGSRHDPLWRVDIDGRVYDKRARSAANAVFAAMLTDENAGHWTDRYHARDGVKILVGVERVAVR